MPEPVHFFSTAPFVKYAVGAMVQHLATKADDTERLAALRTNITNLQRWLALSHTNPARVPPNFDPAAAHALIGKFEAMKRGLLQKRAA